jgi:hypothetical protein
MAATHYKLSSAMNVGDRIRVAGTIITAEEAKSIKQFDLLVEDEHLVPTEAPQVPTMGTPASPFPGRKKVVDRSADPKG